MMIITFMQRQREKSLVITRMITMLTITFMQRQSEKGIVITRVITEMMMITFMQRQSVNYSNKVIPLCRGKVRMALW